MGRINIIRVNPRTVFIEHNFRERGGTMRLAKREVLHSEFFYILLQTGIIIDTNPNADIAFGSSVTINTADKEGNFRLNR